MWWDEKKTLRKTCMTQAKIRKCTSYNQKSMEKSRTYGAPGNASSENKYIRVADIKTKKEPLKASTTLYNKEPQQEEYKSDPAEIFLLSHKIKNSKRLWTARY